MALLKGNPSTIPSDAVILTEEEAIKYQLNLLQNWKYTSDIWPIKYGGTFLASISALSGIYINNHYRNKLKLFYYGRLASYLPICVIPACLSVFGHTQFVLPSVILQKGCAVCTEIRATSLQAFTGFLLPNVLAPFATFSLAIRYGTYDIPYITSEPMKVLYLCKKITKPISNVLLIMFLGHALAGSIVTYLEAKSLDKCNERLIQLEYEVEKALK